MTKATSIISKSYEIATDGEGLVFFYSRMENKGEVDSN
jgi:hypothetical protein